MSYFMYPYQNSQLKRFEWRIWDPSQGADSLFLSFPGGLDGGLDGGFGGVRWDTTFDSAFFAANDSLYRVQWRLGAKPRLITVLPTGHGPWWFSPDSGCWQALRILGQAPTDDPNDPYYNRYGGELWQATHDGSTWRRVRADTLDLVDSDNERWQWSDGTQLPRAASAVSEDDLASEAWEGAWGDKIVPLDMSTFTLLEEDPNGYYSDQWFFLRLQVSPRRGIAFQRSGPLAPEHNWSGVNGPFYFVDLDRRTKTPIEASGSGLMRSLVAEHCGFLLVPGVMGGPFVIDSSGRRAFSQPWNAEGAIWAPRPRP